MIFLQVTFNYCLFTIQVQNTGHIFLLLVCIVVLGNNNNKKTPKNACFSSPPVPKHRAAPVFHFQISRQKTAPKHLRARAVTFAIVRCGKMSFIRVQVICGVKSLRPWYGRIVPESITIADLFDMVQTGIFDSGPPIINSLREHGLLDETDKL